jgi:hypothetical protein
MACDAADAATQALIDSLAGPAYMQTDAGSVHQHNITDLLKAVSFLQGTCAGSSVRRGLRFNRLLPDGPVHRPGPRRCWR